MSKNYFGQIAKFGEDNLTTAKLLQVEDFQQSGLTLNFDLDLWKVNGEICHRC